MRFIEGWRRRSAARRAHGTVAARAGLTETDVTSPSTSSFAFLSPSRRLYLRHATTAERALAIDPSLTIVSLPQLDLHVHGRARGTTYEWSV